jgi:hypothetical protein
MECKNGQPKTYDPKLILHFDINKTLIAMDSAQNLTKSILVG